MPLPLSLDLLRVAINMSDAGESIPYLQKTFRTFCIPYRFTRHGLEGGVAVNTSSPAGHTLSEFAVEVKCMINCVDTEALTATSADCK